MNYLLCTLLFAHLQFNFSLLLFGDMLLLFRAGAIVLLLLLQSINTNHLFFAQKLITRSLLLLMYQSTLGEIFITVVEAAVLIFMNQIFRLFLARGTDNTFL